MNDFLLRLNLQYFSADTGGAGGTSGQEQSQAGETQDPQGQGSHTADGQQGNDGSQQNNQEHMIPKSRFDEVNSKYKELESKLEKFTKEQQQAELEAKKKKGEYEGLYNEAQSELENYKTTSQQSSQRVEQLEGIIQTLVDAELEAVPEDLRDLVPDNFTPEQKLSWITNAKQKGIFGAQKSNKQHEELGGSTNSQGQQVQDVSKMSVTQLLKSAYGSK